MLTMVVAGKLFLRCHLSRLAGIEVCEYFQLYISSIGCLVNEYKTVLESFCAWDRLAVFISSFEY